jgi:hypothetical protein
LDADLLVNYIIVGGGGGRRRLRFVAQSLCGREAEEDRLCRVSRCQSERNLTYYDRSRCAGRRNWRKYGGGIRTYSSFIDVSALGIGGQEVNFTDKTTGGWNWVHVQLGGYRDWRMA